MSESRSRSEGALAAGRSRAGAILSRARGVLPWVIVLAVLSARAPGWIANWKLEGQPLPREPLAAAGSLTDALNEPRSKVLVFWATWCGPCDVELKRFAEAVREDKLPADRVLAVSIDADAAAYRREVAERKYPFRTFLDRQGLASRLRVEVTPTVVHLRADQTIAYATSGVSPLAIWRAERFLGE